MQWLNETQLEEWAKRTDARAFLVDMVADLIRASVPDATQFRFPGGDKAQVRGFDGDLETAISLPFVPIGKSKWEFGVSHGAGKAKGDYDTRTKETADAIMSENTLVLVNLTTWDTPREELVQWVADRRAEGKWADVRYLDGVELVHWLDMHPAVAARYAREVLDTAPKRGAISTDEFWAMYCTRFKPTLTEQVVVSGRESEVGNLLIKLAGPAQAILLGSESSEEVVAFAVAAIRNASAEQRMYLEARTLIVETEDAARFLVAKSNVVFITTGKADKLAGLLGGKGPTLSAATGVQARQHPQLPRPTASAMGEALMTMGFSREDGYELAAQCGRSITILQRLKPSGPTGIPEWVPYVDALKPAFLAGGWSIEAELDKELLKDLSGLPDYSNFEGGLLKTLTLSDPPMDRVADVWQVRAPVDAFAFYGHLIGTSELQRFRTAAIRVFSHSVEKPSRDEKFSLTYSPPADYSSWLRDGLAMTLLLFAAMPKIGGLQVPGKTPQQFVDEILNADPVSFSLST